ncbi:hypothetical protein [uncultured Tateyamaria sp.]|uniref:hypothetical protein n=1 Tax=uncultured Tateyamaria sp. TaxID=455651 RepID=UPI00260A3135|nr:hypothetical protein [uncultured Tateyamaria sp.]
MHNKPFASLFAQARTDCINELVAKAATRRSAAAPVFYAVNGNPFAKQRSAAKERAEAEALRDAKQKANRAERLSNLGTAGEYIPPTRLGLFD